MRLAIVGFAMAVIATSVPSVAAAQITVSTIADLRKFNVTILRFNPAKGPQSGEKFVLPVDSPDEEHAIASTIANAASFSKKFDGGRVLPVAFVAVRVVPR